MGFRFDNKERDFLVDGFRNGFDIGYTGPKIRQSRAQNIPFMPGIGDKWDMWSKIMKEVKAKRYAGPYDEIPFENYIQSPIGLVPKHGNKTRLIFHLSFDFDEKHQSVNACTPKEWCSVKYNDLDAAIANCLKVSHEALTLNGTGTVFLGKTDLFMAFRVLPMKIGCICWLVLMAQDPLTGETKFFIDKCLPFGASISCSHYQRFSNSLRWIIEFRTGHHSITNYLDDFLFAAISRLICNYLIEQFLLLCSELHIPVAIEKTEWATTLIIFLGILLDGERLLLSIPLDKRDKALKLLRDIMGKRKITVMQLQVLTGYLNFLTKAIPPGRTFTRRMYAKYANLHPKLKQHHHVAIDREFRFDCNIWRIFLSNYQNSAVCRPMIDFKESVDASSLNFYSDASASASLGFGAVYENRWIFGQWQANFINEQNPSIEYLELFGVTAAILTWDC